jgi:hypothetical protein
VVTGEVIVAETAAAGLVAGGAAHVIISAVAGGVIGAGVGFGVKMGLDYLATAALDRWSVTSMERFKNAKGVKTPTTEAELDAMIESKKGFVNASVSMFDWVGKSAKKDVNAEAKTASDTKGEAIEKAAALVAVTIEQIQEVEKEVASKTADQMKLELVEAKIKLPSEDVVGVEIHSTFLEVFYVAMLLQKKAGVAQETEIDLLPLWNKHAVLGFKELKETEEFKKIVQEKPSKAEQFKDESSENLFELRTMLFVASSPFGEILKAATVVGDKADDEATAATVAGVQQAEAAVIASGEKLAATIVKANKTMDAAAKVLLPAAADNVKPETDADRAGDLTDANTANPSAVKHVQGTTQTKSPRG